MQLREHLLVLRCQVGDEAAFSGLYDRFGNRTLRYLDGLVGPDAAADVQQEVWLAAFRGISRVTNPGGFRTWLYQITRHQAIDFLRKRKREAVSVGWNTWLAPVGAIKGSVSYTQVFRTAMAFIWVLGTVSVLIAILSTVGMFMRLRTASLVEIQLRRAAVEEMLLAQGNGGEMEAR